MEDMTECVAEFKLWLSNLTGLASYYRTSGKRTKDLAAISDESNEKTLKFLKHHEIRFAEHNQKLRKATVHNISHCSKHSEKINSSTK